MSLSAYVRALRADREGVDSILARLAGQRVDVAVETQARGAPGDSALRYRIVVWGWAGERRSRLVQSGWHDELAEAVTRLHLVLDLTEKYAEKTHG